MLLIDGVRYELWTPKKEVEEFHPLVKEHYREIFGENSIFIEGNRLESESGRGSVPDGFVLTLGEAPQWHIVEMELSTHQLYDHIVNQVGRFINGVKNTATQKKVIEAIYHYIQETKQRKAEVEEAIGTGEIYKLVTDVVSKSPVLTIIIEKRTRGLDEALDLLRYSPIKIVEFQTYRRVGAEAVHAHLFEPVLQPITPLTPPAPPPPHVPPESYNRAGGLRLYIKDGKHYNPKEALLALGASLEIMVEGRGDRRATMPDGTILEYVGSSKDGKSKIAKVHAYLLDHGFIFS